MITLFSRREEVIIIGHLAGSLALGHTAFSLNMTPLQISCDGNHLPNLLEDDPSHMCSDICG